MKKIITISIPEPCHEDWNKMTPTQKGKFCGICEKEVIDFSKFTDSKIVDYFQENKKLCGRFKASQLNREFRLKQKPFFKVPAYAASLLVPFALLSTTQIQAQEKPIASNNSKSNYVSLQIGSRTNTNNVTNNVTIKGVITDGNSVPLSGVLIQVKGLSVETLTKADGTYKIEAYPGETLQFILDGYASAELIIEENVDHISIALVSEEKTQEASIAIVIKGNITDDTGLPLPGTNIIIKGTSIGTQSDFDGNYSLEVQSGQSITYSYVGFKTQEIVTSTISNTIDVKMEVTESMILGGFTMGVVITSSNGVSKYNKAASPHNFSYNSYNLEREAEKKKWKQAEANTNKFKRIKLEKKKEARRKKRNERRNNN